MHLCDQKCDPTARRFVKSPSREGIVKSRWDHREWQKGGMNDTRSTLRYPGFLFPAEIIGYAVWLYHRFTPSFRNIEDLLAERGIIMTLETIRQWCLRFGRLFSIRPIEVKRFQAICDCDVCRHSRFLSGSILE